MKCVIWKYELKNKECSLEVPRNAKTTDIQIIDGVVWIWVMFDISVKEMETRHFRSIYTGEEFETSMVTVGHKHGLIEEYIPELGCLRILKTLRNRATGIVVHVFEEFGKVE